jgi:hypothetical protein
MMREPLSPASALRWWLVVQLAVLVLPFVLLAGEPNLPAARGAAWDLGHLRLPGFGATMDLLGLVAEVVALVIGARDLWGERKIRELAGTPGVWEPMVLTVPDDHPEPAVPYPVWRRTSVRLTPTGAGRPALELKLLPGQYNPSSFRPENVRVRSDGQPEPLLVISLPDGRELWPSGRATAVTES